MCGKVWFLRIGALLWWFFDRGGRVECVWDVVLGFCDGLMRVSEFLECYLDIIVKTF
jgi:hypothetical protein